MPRPYLSFILEIFLISRSLFSTAQNTISPAELKKLSVEELMNMKVTLVTRTPQRLRDAASAIQMITGNEISVVGQNLAKEEHTEFDVLKIPRSFYAKIIGRFRC